VEFEGLLLLCGGVFSFFWFFFFFFFLFFCFLCRLLLFAFLCLLCGVLARRLYFLCHSLPLGGDTFFLPY